MPTHLAPNYVCHVSLIKWLLAYRKTTKPSTDYATITTTPPTRRSSKSGYPNHQSPGNHERSAVGSWLSRTYISNKINYLLMHAACLDRFP